jgi:hypothetical protein
MLDAKTALARETIRAELVGQIPRWYNPWAHLAATTCLGLGFCALAASRIHQLTPLQLLIVPLVWVFSNASEWRAHRDLLHKIQPGAKLLFTRHTLQHHQLYFTDDMEIRDTKELRLVLFPPFAIGLIFVTTLPIAALFWFLGERNLAALFIITTQLYVVTYEWLHMSYHLPRESFIGRRWLVRKLGRHHAIHHALERMNVWNMNVNFPLWDWVRGTIYHGGDSAAVSRPAAKIATLPP